MHVKFGKVGEVAHHVDDKEGRVTEGHVQLVGQGHRIHSRGSDVGQDTGENVQLLFSGDSLQTHICRFLTKVLK